MNRSYSLTRAEIVDVIKNGKPLHSLAFTMKTVSGESIKNIKIAFIAPKKIFPTAVLRNKAKRRAKEIVRKLLRDFKNAKYVFLLKKQAVEMDTKTLTEAFINGISLRKF